MGERLGRWLSQPGADLPVLQANLNRHGVVRLFATRIHGELGSETDVEISAARNDDSKASTIVLLLRDVGRRLPEPNEGRSLRTALSSLIGQSGKTTLPKLVDEAVETVERHYIEAALDMVDGNRTAAAELLGLSRQSLYKKLTRYELAGNEEVEEQHGTTM
jgi:transcriptional regulator PpsR